MCKKCNSKFSLRIWIDGKKRNLQNRKYCFVCSPFGSHNTRNLHDVKTESDNRNNGLCERCGGKINDRQKRGHVCWNCYQKDRVEKVRNKVHDIVGEKCWLCGYDKGVDGRKVLDFHHMDPKIKNFNLSVRNMCNLNWDRVFSEIKKCVLICCRCHREVEYGLIDKSKVEGVYRDFWECKK